MSSSKGEEELQLIDEDKKEFEFIKVGRASIAALDLPIEYNGNMQSMSKSQSTPHKISIFDNKNKEQDIDNEMKHDLPPKGVLHRAHSLDSGKEKIVSVPTIEQIKLISNESDHHEIKEEVVVPPRNVLIKMPFYSTPLTIEATNNAFRDFMVRLNEMGFIEEAEAALVATNAESVEAAVDFIMNNPDGLFHRFIPNELVSISINNQQQQQQQLCIACGLKKNDHIINENGDKIIIHDQLYGDLNGRVSMSINTKQQREKQKIALQEIIDKRVRSIAEDKEDKDDDDDDDDDDNKEDKEDKENKEDKDNKDNAENKEDKEEDDDDEKTEICLICFDDRPLDMFYRTICGHNYCKICLEQHYKIKIVDGDVLKLSCIDPKCNRLICEDEILSFLIDEELRNKFIKFRQSKLLMLNPNARFCCKPDCEGSMIGNRMYRKLQCPICGTLICFNCSQPWHGLFVGCNQNIDIGYTKWALNKDVQKCPKCRMGIEKEDGCNHMTCSSCKYEFCWICKGPYNDHHFEWWNIFGCPGAQYTPRFCRCPHCFPRWLNRILIILCFLAVVIPIVIVAAIFWLLIVCLIFCIRCDFKCDIDPCDCF